MKKIHIKGKASAINISNELSNNYDLTVYFQFDEETTEVVENVSVKIYSSKNESTLEEAEEGHLRKLLGDMSMTGTEYGYSEYTIEGFNVWDVTIGGHNLQDIVNAYDDEYLHILIEQVN